MSLLKGIFGLSQEEIWNQFAIRFLLILKKLDISERLVSISKKVLFDDNI